MKLQLHALVPYFLLLYLVFQTLLFFLDAVANILAAPLH